MIERRLRIAGPLSSGTCFPKLAEARRVATPGLPHASAGL